MHTTSGPLGPAAKPRYAILGITLFRENDPTNFGDLHMVMVVLFRCATMEDWTDVMCALNHR